MNSKVDGPQAKKAVEISIIVPVLNEMESIPIFIERMSDVLNGADVSNFEFVFVNDGSTDETLQVLLKYAKQSAQIKVIDLSRNFGKEAAMTAGLFAASGDAVVPIDVDLQDPPELIPAMIEKWREGYEVVLARREDRSSDTVMKRGAAAWFYRFHNLISKPKIPENVGDFRLIDRCAVEALKQLPETHRFMKGLFAWIGFRTTTINYTREQRSAGTSKFKGWQLWNFALEGLTSFSTFPLRIWTYVGLTVSSLSFVFGIWIVVASLTIGNDVPGYASLMVAVTFLGGLQLLGIGVLGEYLGRTYVEAKRRPIYIVRQRYGFED